MLSVETATDNVISRNDNCLITQNDKAINESTDIFDDYATTAFDIEYFEYVRSTVGLWLLIVCILGTPANLLVVRCAWKLCRTKRSNLLYQYFVLSMTAADLIFVSIVAPALFFQYYLHVKYARFWCTSMYVLSHCSTVCSSLSLLCLNTDKFIAIFRPLHHASIVTRRRVTSAVILCWLLSICWSTFFVFGPALTYKEPCSLIVASFGYYLVFTMCFFVTPTCVAAILGTFIAAIAYRNERQQAELRFAQSSSADCGRRNTVTSAKIALNGHHNNNNLTISRARTFTFVFATTAWSCLTYLPYRIMYPIYISGRFVAWHLPVGFAFFAMMAANPAGNPIITVVTQRRYRILLIKFWRTSYLADAIRITTKVLCRRKNGDKRDGNGNTNVIITSETPNRSGHNEYLDPNECSDFGSGFE